MSDTPKLLALMVKCKHTKAYEYAKQLEGLAREVERENAALRKDSARLNWFINLDEEDRVKFCRGWYRWTPEQVRAEIDEELRKEAQP